MASAEVPEEMWTTAFSPTVIRERMRWVMEYDLLGELANKLAAEFPSNDLKESIAGEDEVRVTSVL